jgi:dTDP-4-dehydrorhamnose reductase
MKVLLTGSNGLLGQKLVDLFLQENIEFLAISRGNNRHPHSHKFQYQNVDIVDKGSLHQCFTSYKPDVILNTAALTNVDACETQKEECVALNVTAVRDMFEYAKANNAFLIQLSTDFIFDGKDGPYKEEDKPNPLSFYGQSKWDAEQILINDNYSNWAILRTIIVYGLVNEMSRSNLVLWAKSALEKGQKINVVNDQFRSPTLAEDLAMACLLAIKKHATGIYNISGETTYAVNELVEQVAEVFNLDKSLINATDSVSLGQPANRPPRTGFIIDKAKKELGFKPHTFKEGLQMVKQQLEK